MNSHPLHTPITPADLAQARELLAQGRLSQMYDVLAAHGDRYSTLAKGVVEGNTLSGVAALEFMQRRASWPNAG